MCSSWSLTPPNSTRPHESCRCGTALMGSASSSRHSRSVQHFIVRFPIGGVTTASGRFESAAVQYLDLTAMIFYVPAALQYAGSRRDADAADAEHVREEFMGDVKAIRMGAILRHQKPARQARPDLVKAQTRRGRCELHHHHVNVAIEALLQRRTVREFPAERGSANAPSRSRALHQRMQRSDRDAQCQLRPQHSFAAHHPYL